MLLAVFGALNVVVAFLPFINPGLEKVAKATPGFSVANLLALVIGLLCIFWGIYCSRKAGKLK